MHYPDSYCFELSLAKIQLIQQPSVGYGEHKRTMSEPSFAFRCLSGVKGLVLLVGGQKHEREFQSSDEGEKHIHTLCSTFQIGRELRSKALNELSDFLGRIGNS